MNDGKGLKIANLVASVLVLLFLLVMASGLYWAGSGPIFVLLSLAVTGGVIAWVVLAIRGLVVKPAPIHHRPAGTFMPAGWYPDQQDPSQVRWFNGTEWTAATLPRQ